MLFWAFRSFSAFPGGKRPSGYPLVSFCPMKKNGKKDTASIPNAVQKLVFTRKLAVKKLTWRSIS